MPTELIPVPLPRSLAPTTSNQRSSTQASTGQDARNADAERGSAAGQTLASPPASSSGAQAADQKSAAAQAFDLEPPESLPEPAPQTQAPDTDRIPWPATPEAEDELGGDAHSGAVQLQERYLLEFPITAAEVQEVKTKLETYTQRVAALMRQGQAKPDMVANKDLRATLTPEGVYGHIKGIPVGQTFANKGELAILGLHGNINSGIHSKGKVPAFSVVLSGGYEDKDEGDYVEYCGMGGRDSHGHFVKDQTWTAGNYALKLNAEQGVPVRLFRRKRKELALTYDGLYKVGDPEHKLAKHGWHECRFTLTGVPGHYRVGERVLYNEKRSSGGRLVIQGGPRQRRQLFGSDAAAGRAAVEVARGTNASNRQRGRLVLSDISRGLEAKPIPVYNNHNAEMPPEDFTYIKDSELTTDAARALAAEGRAAMESASFPTCSVRLHTKEFGAYNGAKLLMATIDEGVLECPAPCETSACARTRVVTAGITLPLEVFHTGSERGWGVRCRQGITPGSYLCSYAGAALADTEAEALHQHTGHDAYLYDLSHFLQRHHEGPEDAISDTDEDPHAPPTDFAKMPPVPAACLQKYADDMAVSKAAAEQERNDDSVGEAEKPKGESHIVLDARRRGNIARFINHSCSANCIVQPVLVAGESGLWYHVAIFAMKSIAPLAEVTYNYNYVPGQSSSVIDCRCGADECRGRLT